MGYLLKEALKTLCGVNQWSYAVFWKIGCQNPKLLIWEECFFEPKSSSILPSIPGFGRAELPFREWEGGSVSTYNCSTQERSQAGEAVVSLVNKMMINNQVNVVGEGIVGRAAFTGNYQWILSNNYIVKAHPPEVLAEMRHQFAAGMQTVAVIPVLPHGVVQLGSSLAIMENMGFVNDVKSLILQLGCIPGSLFSDSYSTKESGEKIGIPCSLGSSLSMDTSGNYHGISVFSSPKSSAVGQSSHPVNQDHSSLKSSAPIYQGPNAIQAWSKCHIGRSQPQTAVAVNSNILHRHGLEGGVVGAEVIPLNPDAWLNEHGFPYISGSGPRDQFSNDQEVSENDAKLLEQGILSNSGPQSQKNGVTSSLNSSVASQLKTEEHAVLQTRNDASNGGSNLARSKVRGTLLPNSADKLAISQEFSNNCCSIVGKHSQKELDPCHSLSSPQEHTSLRNDVSSVVSDCHNVDSSGRSLRSADAEYEDRRMQPSLGDDLFDVLGADFKNKLLSGHGNSFLMNGVDSTVQNGINNILGSINMQDVVSDLHSVSEATTDYSGIFSGIGTDNLLDAVVSSSQSVSKQCSDDNLSCGTTVTKISSSSVPTSTPTYNRLNISDQACGNFLNLPKQLAKGGTLGTSSFISARSKDDPGNCSHTSSIFGSQISSWVEQGHNVKRESSVSTAYSKKPDETSKSSRKRLKPGENPRPRPKDRQMIQDRVKELREIVPNGAKCSIDALLERTIKHMLFLQSVTKHADKLKQTGEPKIISKDGGLLLKDNFEGGATWAFEVGSQSMVCPIIVEDLNPPRQMLVEMLCEERGFFLEIADLIRGLGLTILKGVMEVRNGKVWARFAVEANRDVTRMEIFMSLVRLLEQTMKGSASSSVSPVDNNNMIVQHSLPTAASIPVTGGPSTLQ